MHKTEEVNSYLLKSKLRTPHSNKTKSPQF
jgi:hypothetical protein